MTCQEFEELSGAYALGATTPEENLAAEAHLADCHRCTKLLRELQDVVNLLPLTVPDVEPSPQLRNRILSSIEAEAAKAPMSERPLLHLQQLAPSQRPAPLKEPVYPTGQRRRQRWQMPVMSVAAAILLVLFAGMLTWNLSLHSQNQALQQQNNLLNTQAARLTPLVYAIHGTKAGQPTNGYISYYPQQNITVLIIHGLPKTSGNQVYQGWLIQNNQPKSIGVFNVQDGTATLNFVGNPSGYAETAVSLEKGPHATPVKPAGQVVAVGTISNQ
ncbi:MAG TPA: anti-sigma factor [Ktedonobacteraceae bacterium]|nr:anti-sigma factor [Ktedonobacteraceae bacterium]